MKVNNIPIHIIIPAYNEEEMIGEVICELNKLDINLKIFVVNDGSKDNTSAIAKKAGTIVIEHIVNFGQWAALKTGFIVSILNGAQIIVTIDADGQHSPENLLDIITPILKGEADLIIGSRFLNEKKPSMQTHRYLGIKFFNILMKLITGKRFTDCTSGYKAYNKDLLMRLIPLLSENQYGALEAIIYASKLGARILEIPIDSNASNKTTKGRLKYLFNLLRILFKSITQ